MGFGIDFETPAFITGPSAFLSSYLNAKRQSKTQEKMAKANVRHQEMSNYGQAFSNVVQPLAEAYSQKVIDDVSLNRQIAGEQRQQNAYLDRMLLKNFGMTQQAMTDAGRDYLMSQGPQQASITDDQALAAGFRQAQSMQEQAKLGGMEDQLQLREKYNRRAVDYNTAALNVRDWYRTENDKEILNTRHELFPPRGGGGGDPVTQQFMQQGQQRMQMLAQDPTVKAFNTKEYQDLLGEENAIGLQLAQGAIDKDQYMDAMGQHEEKVLSYVQRQKPHMFESQKPPPDFNGWLQKVGGYRVTDENGNPTDMFVYPDANGGMKTAKFDREKPGPSRPKSYQDAVQSGQWIELPKGGVVEWSEKDGKHVLVGGSKGSGGNENKDWTNIFSANMKQADADAKTKSQKGETTVAPDYQTAANNASMQYKEFVKQTTQLEEWTKNFQSLGKIRQQRQQLQDVVDAGYNEIRNAPQPRNFEEAKQIGPTVENARKKLMGMEQQLKAIQDEENRLNGLVNGQSENGYSNIGEMKKRDEQAIAPPTQPAAAAQEPPQAKMTPDEIELESITQQMQEIAAKSGNRPEMVSIGDRRRLLELDAKRKKLRGAVSAKPN